MKTLNSLVMTAKDEILILLSSGPINDRVLMPKVVSSINWRETRELEIVHETKPVHISAYILAYKQLEEEHKIQITRPADVPFPMTDFMTTFALKSDFHG